MLAEEGAIDIKFLMDITGIDRERLLKIQESRLPLIKFEKLQIGEKIVPKVKITMDKLDIGNKTVTTVALADALPLAFITSSADGKWLFTGGVDKILSVIDRQSNSIHLQVPLQSLALCCYMKGNMLFIGGH